MKKTKYDGALPNKILAAMVVDDTVARRIAHRWAQGGLFASRWANVVGGWCAAYAAKYGAAPRAHVEDMFQEWADAGANDDEVGLVDEFLGGLSGAYEKEAEAINPEYIIDLAGKHFNEVAADAMAAAVRARIDTGHGADVDEIITNYRRVELGVGAGLDFTDADDAIDAAFAAKAAPLITYPGALGEFFSDQFSRDEFVAFTGATGRGKTWWLIDVAWAGMRQRRNVAFFSVGDMSEAQVLRRLACRAAKHPLKPPYDVRVPTSIARGEGDIADVETEVLKFGGALQPGAAKAAIAKLRRRSAGRLRISCHPNSSIGVAGITNVLDMWEQQYGWIAEVVVIDYADVLKPPHGIQAGEREAHNQNWMQMRGLSQARHCLVVTATQGDAGSYEAELIRRGNFSDDRRKNDHITGGIGINQTEAEKAEGIYRLNWTKRREEEFLETRCVYLAGCLGIGRPWVVSTW